MIIPVVPHIIEYGMRTNQRPILFGISLLLFLTGFLIYHTISLHTYSNWLIIPTLVYVICSVILSWRWLGYIDTLPARQQLSVYIIYVLTALTGYGGLPALAAIVSAAAPMSAVVAIGRRRVDDLAVEIAQPQRDPDGMWAFFGMLYGEGRGWLEICYIDGDPQHERTKRAGWYFYKPGGEQVLIDWIRQLANQFGNVYVSSTLYHEKKRSAAAATMSRIVFVDDAPDGDYSAVVRTSAASRHAYFVLDREIAPDERRDLQRRAAAELGADRSGADITQIVRVPGSFNTKRHGWWPVQLESFVARTYSPDALREQWPAVPKPAMRPGAPVGLDWPEIETWLGNIDELLRDGLPRRLKNPNGQARRVLAGKVQAPSTSDARAWVAKGLILHRYPDAEAAALLLHFCDYGASDRKGNAWLYQDVANLIVRYRAERPDIRPEASKVLRTKTPAQLSQLQPTRRGRKVAITLSAAYEKLTELIACNRIVCETRGALAAAWGVSTGTVDRRLDDMIALGWIARETLANRRALRLVLTKDTDSGVITIAEITPEIAPANCDHTMPVERITKPTPEVAPVHEGTHPPIPAGARVLSLRHLVSDGVDAYGSHLRRVLRYVLDNGGEAFNPAAVVRCYRAELRARRWQRQAVVLLGKLPKLRLSELKKRATSAGSYANTLQQRGAPKSCWWFWYAGQLESEITRRSVTNQAQPATDQAQTLPSTAGAAHGGCVPSEPQQHESVTSDGVIYEWHGCGWRARLGALVTVTYVNPQAVAHAVAHSAWLSETDVTVQSLSAPVVRLNPSSAARFRFLFDVTACT